MLTLRNLWGGVLFLGVMLVLAQGAVPAGPTAWRSPPPGAATPGSSWKNCGAAAPSSSTRTPRTPRAGKFERAYIRYIFLNAHIRGQSLEPAAWSPWWTSASSS